VHHAVGAEDVDRDELGVEVYGGPAERYTDCEALCVAEVFGRCVEGWDGVAVQYAAGWVEVV
jgi:hypothetical protein